MENNDTPTASTEETTAAAPAQASHAKPGNSQLTTALIVIIVVLLFAMLMLSMNGQLFQSGNNKSDLTDLETRNAQLRAEANAERKLQGLPPLPEDAISARQAADRLQRDASALAAMASQWQKVLEEKDAQLRTLENTALGHRDQVTSLYKRINELEERAAQSASAAEQLVALSNDLKMANNQIENYRNQLAEFQGRPTTEEADRLRKQLTESMDSRSKLQIQIDGLIAASENKIDRTEYDQIATEVKQLRSTNNAQRYEIQRLRAQLDRAKLFIESEKNLPTEAARLYAKLLTLEKANKQQLEAAYETIRATLGAEIIHRQTFAKGSSQITFDKEKIIQDILDRRKDGKSFFLVVGYASKSGGKDANRQLSANRATTVASIVNVLKAPGQQVKAVYLGETARFSATAEIENQICEIWEIKR